MQRNLKLVHDTLNKINNNCKYENLFMKFKEDTELKSKLISYINSCVNSNKYKAIINNYFKTYKCNNINLLKVLQVKKITEQEYKALFNALNTNKNPKLSLLEYFERIIYYLDVNWLIIPMVAILVERLIIRLEALNTDNINFCLNNKNIFYAVCGLMYIIIKLFCDGQYSKEVYSLVFGLSLAKIKTIENEILLLLDYNVFINYDELNEFIFYVKTNNNNNNNNE